MTGIVYLIGAGPGDYKLITVKGRECIERADVIVYDYLADSHLLQYARPDAEIIYAGKRCRNHTMHQWEINDLLVEKCREGKVVARLKGGDPLVFGRGGEEAMALHDAGLPFEFVPGVTSAISAPAYAGIPVTQRAMATSFAVVTGHEDPTKPVSGIHWEGLAQSVDTITFVMGVTNLPTIASKLMEYGRPPETPVALIRWGTKPIQETLVSTLEHVVEDVAKAGLKAPAIIVVGEVVNLREQLRWFDTKPLFGKTIVTTRAKDKGRALTEKLMGYGAHVIEASAIKTQALPLLAETEAMLENLSSYTWLLFTSAEGVRYFFEVLASKHKDVRALGHLKVCAIGSATAKALEGHGIIADLIPVNYKAESVVEALQPLLADGDRLLMVQPKKARSVIQEGLGQVGMAIDVLRLYETLQDTSSRDELVAALQEGHVDYITFTSASTVTHTVDLLGPDYKSLLGQTKLACIGPITAARLVELGLEPAVISPVYTMDGLTEAIVGDVQS